MRDEDTATVISAQLTGWFWLSLLAAIGIIISSFAQLLRRRRPGL
jgi:hypothetical protein